MVCLLEQAVFPQEVSYSLGAAGDARPTFPMELLCVFAPNCGRTDVGATGAVQRECLAALCSSRKCRFWADVFRRLLFPGPLLVRVRPLFFLQIKCKVAGQ